MKQSSPAQHPIDSSLYQSEVLPPATSCKDATPRKWWPGRRSLAAVCALALPFISGCAQNNANNDCLIQAARAQAELPRNTWSRILLVKYQGHPLGHVYTIYELPGHRVFAYDNVFGSRRVKPRSLFLHDLLPAVDRRADGGRFLEDTYAGPSLAR